VAKIKKYNKTCQLIKATRIPKGTTDEVLEQLFADVIDIMKLSNLIGALGVSAMKQRHWAKVFDLLKEVPPSSLDTMTLQMLLDMGAAEYIGLIDDISGAAQGEE